MKKLFFPMLRKLGNLFGQVALSRFIRVSPYCRLVAALLFFQGHLPPLLAQEKAKQDRGVIINFTFGPVISPVSKNLKKELRVENERYSKYDFYGIPYTRTNYLVRPWAQLGIEFPIKDQWSVKGALSNWGGNFRAYGRSSNPIMVSPSVSSVAGLLAWHFGQHALRLAAGPAYHLVIQKASQENYVGDVYKQVGKAGFVVEGGLRFPANTSFFADIQMQYQRVGSVGFGPYSFQRQNNQGDPDTFTVAFKEVPMNMLVLGFGVGLRLP